VDRSGSELLIFYLKREAQRTCAFSGLCEFTIKGEGRGVGNNVDPNGTTLASERISHDALPSKSQHFSYSEDLKEKIGGADTARRSFLLRERGGGTRNTCEKRGELGKCSDCNRKTCFTSSCLST